MVGWCLVCAFMFVQVLQTRTLYNNLCIHVSLCVCMNVFACNYVCMCCMYMCKSMYIRMYINMYVWTVMDSWSGNNIIFGVCLWSFSTHPLQVFAGKALWHGIGQSWRSLYDYCFRLGPVSRAWIWVQQENTWILVMQNQILLQILLSSWRALSWRRDSRRLMHHNTWNKRLSFSIPPTIVSTSQTLKHTFCCRW